MSSITLVMGQAGTGKTTWLMEKATELAPDIVTDEYQRLLVLTRMHGARRRLEMELETACPVVARQVSTIDGFALSVVNRFRLSLGIQRPVVATGADVGFTDTLFETEGSFEKIRLTAAELLDSPTIRAIIRRSYPLIIVDEYQDCHGSLLRFVNALGECSQLLLAADDFQLLDSDVPGCPAVEHITAMNEEGLAVIEPLETIHRTDSPEILEAARCLRTNVKATSATLPVICCPNHGPVAWHIVSRLVLCAANKRWTGRTALICPAHDQFLDKVFKSCNDQLAKKNRGQLIWHAERSIADHTDQVLGLLGLTTTDATENEQWTPEDMPRDPLCSTAIENAKRIAHLRGLQQIPKRMMVRTAEKIVHDLRAYAVTSPRRCVTTVHGAKNREFDNVFVVWTYKLPQSVDAQRKLLYNAITRAKSNCIVLVWGQEKRALNDPVLSLLGRPQPAFPPKKKGKSTKKVGKRRGK